MIEFRPVVLPGDGHLAESLLCGSAWPFHAVAHLDAAAVDAVALVTDDVESHWIIEDGRTVGLIRLLDLADVAVGTPLFDVRLAASERGRGLGTVAVNWLTDHLFTRFGDLHRIEATTRHDNLVMQRVLDRCGYRQEGRLREDWRSEDGSRWDTLVYGILRREWAGAPDR